MKKKNIDLWMQYQDGYVTYEAYALNCARVGIPAEKDSPDYQYAVPVATGSLADDWNDRTEDE